ncbi:hypothetical protein CS063_00315 [Sporanaerobium hydrogeniformans]|uniref:Uncharacterized protein n=1 Tax=Sporanaerobium hydrogeniformans TaxID=3072179 RepID=A0AC61DFC0_9FIRM|nr:V-type ATPase 116kDa subunit family protein [Sporanaerobium hydrogeniformans]PHV71955.1 hypothetical protein CS063_00315 [Sporanaerobium hydrogeniformans]
MAIEKMILLNLVGALDEEHAILQQLVLCENIHLNLEHGDLSENSYLVHEYEAMVPSGKIYKTEDYAQLASHYSELENSVVEMSKGLDIALKIIKEDIGAYSLKNAEEDLKELLEAIKPNIQTMNEKRKQMKELELFKERISHIHEKGIDFGQLEDMTYFEYEIGMLSRDNRNHIKKNYENISALLFQIGDVEASSEDIYIVLYLSQFKEETTKLLKSLNWNKINLPDGIKGNTSQLIIAATERIQCLQKEMSDLEGTIFKNKEEIILRLNRIYSRIKLEEKILQLKEQIIHGNNVFVLNAWIKKKDKKKVEEKIANVTDKYVILCKTAEEVGKKSEPPTLLNNNWFFKPFEMIVKLYGLPSYIEIDPTPFLAITFCLMFGIMFGDIGQGLVYFLAGVILYKKNETAGGVLTRLGGSSILFGFVYGSIFGLEEVPFIKDIALVHGGPLNTTNIMPILAVGVAFGVVVLTVAYGFGIVNCLRKRDLEDGIFGKNGMVGYFFFIGLIFTGLTLIRVVPISVLVPISVMIVSLIMMIFKEPLSNLIEGKRPLIHGDRSSYYVESSFEGIETILSALSNAISFIRVGAFALNHAGLFLAFSVMAGMMNNIVLKVLILVLGNVLILTLEGLVVFIQGLRLQYYEMFSKYFSGDGIAYSPIKLED